MEFVVAIVVVAVLLAHVRGMLRYNRGITIARNEFITFDKARHLLKARFVRGLVWTANKVRLQAEGTGSGAYPKRRASLPQVKVAFSNAVCIDRVCVNGTG